MFLNVFQGEQIVNAVISRKRRRFITAVMMQNQSIYMTFTVEDAEPNGTVYMTPEIPQPNSAFNYYVEPLEEVFPCLFYCDVSNICVSYNDCFYLSHKNWLGHCDAERNQY